MFYTYAYIGSISLGLYTQLYNIGSPINIEYVDNSNFVQTDGGQILYFTATRLKSFDVSLNKNEDEWIEALLVAYDYVHKGKTFWLDRNEDLSTRQPTFGIFASNINTIEGNEFIDASFSFLEAR